MTKIQKIVNEQANVMLAYAEGKSIEIYNEEEDTWYPSPFPQFNWKDFKYRVANTSEYRPFKNSKECWEEMNKHQPFGWINEKSAKDVKFAVIIDDEGIACTDIDDTGIFQEYNAAIKLYEFVDGSPFGVKNK